MSKLKSKIIVILGLTATGKSSLAVKLAKKFGGEIISADSRQVYKGLDIGTGKITEKEMRGVPHYLLDVVNPKQRYSVVKYQKRAMSTIASICKRNKTPIIVGGSGFYVDAITKGIIYPEVSPNVQLREKLSVKPIGYLVKYLSKIDPERAKSIDKHNKIRLIRAIEIVHSIGKVPKIRNKTSKYNFVKIGLRLPQKEHDNKIKSRCKKMLQDGLLTEIEKLKHAGISDDRLHELGFEYNDPNIEKLVLGNKQYSKRQMTWFKRDPDIKWFKIKNKPTNADLEKILRYINSKI